MVFSSLLFTYIFLPVVIVLYYLIRRDSARNYLLLAASLLFYGYGEPRFVFVMMASIVINYAAARLIDRDRRRLWLILAVVVNLGLLFVCKYLDFTISIANRLLRSEIPAVGIALPIGISFFTFQALSYVIDVYRGTVRVQNNLLYVALYISFFPQLIAGPIVRYSTIEEQIAHRTHSLDKFGEGSRRFMLGFCKKVILANNIAEVASSLSGRDPLTTSPLLLWLGAISYTLQIYYDFSGYSDMAIGLGKMFGFDFLENFNYPYIARSVTDFWRRWHISLGTWFRDYVYIPLGGSRVTKPRYVRNLFVVWLLTGIWHGANLTFLAWGLWYFVLLVIERLVIRPEDRKSGAFHVLWRIVTLLCVIFGWVMFNSTSVSHAIRYSLGMLGFYRVGISIEPVLVMFMREYGVFLAAGIIFAVPVAGKIGTWIASHEATERVARYLIPVCYGFLFLWATSFLILGSNNPFIYFNF